MANLLKLGPISKGKQSGRITITNRTPIAQRKYSLFNKLPSATTSTTTAAKTTISPSSTNSNNNENTDGTKKNRDDSSKPINANVNCRDLSPITLMHGTICTQTPLCDDSELTLDPSSHIYVMNDEVDQLCEEYSDYQIPRRTRSMENNYIQRELSSVTKTCDERDDDITKITDISTTNLTGRKYIFGKSHSFHLESIKFSNRDKSSIDIISDSDNGYSGAGVGEEHSDYNRAIRVWFFRNKNFYWKGFSMALMRSKVKSFEMLLEIITDSLRTRVPLNSSIKKLYRINGKPIIDLREFCESDIIICCCSYENYVHGDYNLGSDCINDVKRVVRRGNFTEWQIRLLKSGIPPVGLQFLTADQFPNFITNHINIRNCIYSTESSAIFAGTTKPPFNDAFVIKVLDIQCKNSMEVKTMMKLSRHPNILLMIGALYKENRCFIILKHLDCDLHDLMVQHGAFNIEVSRRVMFDVINGLEYLYRSHIIHRDIKPQNLFVKMHAEGYPYIDSVKIGDFGLAAFGSTKRKLTIFCGTTNFMAPEMYSAIGYSYPVDVWATGVTLYCMLTLQLPFDLRNLSTNVGKRLLKSPAMLNSWSVELKSFLRAILEPEPQKRLHVNELRSHPFMMMNL